LRRYIDEAGRRTSLMEPILIPDEFCADDDVEGDYFI
jgi:hypothetical protein